MNYNSLFKGIVSFLLLVSFTNAHNDCNKILQLGTKNIKECVDNKNGRVVSLKIQNTDLTQDELNKIFTFESITSLELGFSPSGLILPSNLKKISFDGVNLSQSDISELSTLNKLQELGFQNTENVSTEIIKSLNLKRLNIDGIKEIFQELKDTLKTLVNLEELTINVENFSNGDDILNNLKKLKKLSLKTNSIPQNLINEIKTLTNLENLQLDFEEGQSNSIDNNVFANFKKIKTLSLNNIKLSQDNVNEIAKLSNLKQIELYNINLNGLNLDSWKSLAKLENLVLFGNSISAIPEEINNFVNLQTLNITNNVITAITTPLTGLKNLKTLDLSSNLLTTLPNEFGELSSLQSLHVHDNVITDLPTGFGNLNIEYLDLNDNVIKVFPTSILNLKNLKYLDLAYNQLTSLPDNIVNVKNLQYLDLSDNEFIVLPSQLFNMVSLEVINFNYNNLQNTVIPSSIGKMTNLKELYLQNAYIESIPSEIVNCQNIEVLDLSSNNISSIPSKFGNLKNLKKLYLSDNYITSISTELGKLKNLVELDLSYNEINGDIPTTLHQLNYLEVISLAYNEDIEGEVLTNRGLSTCEYTIGTLLCKSKEMICLGNADLPNCTTAGTVVSIDIGPDSDYSDVIDEEEPTTTIVEDIPTTTIDIEIPTTTTDIEIPTTTTTITMTTTTTTSTPTSTYCWAEALGYPCCSPDNTTVFSQDEDGDWGYDFELGEWCGISSNNEVENPVNETCWSEKLGYPCCTGCKVYYVDSDGSWGVENKDWCGIKPTCSN